MNINLSDESFGTLHLYHLLVTGHLLLVRIYPGIQLCDPLVHVLDVLCYPLVPFRFGYHYLLYRILYPVEVFLSLL